MKLPDKWWESPERLEFYLPDLPGEVRFVERNADGSWFFAVRRNGTTTDLTMPTDNDVADRIRWVPDIQEQWQEDLGKLNLGDYVKVYGNGVLFDLRGKKTPCHGYHDGVRHVPYLDVNGVYYHEFLNGRSEVNNAIIVPGTWDDYQVEKLLKELGI